jgi:4'-phosphopantetheinyl transferase
LSDLFSGDLADAGPGAKGGPKWMMMYPPVQSTLLSRGVVHLWSVDPARVGQQNLQRHFDRLLDSAEQRRCLRYAFQRDRQLFLASRALLRTVLSRYEPIPPGAWRFAVDRYGKPQIERSPGALDLRFSVTHTPGLAAVAVTTGREVGVDAELVSRAVDAMPLAEQFFAPAEAADLKTLPPREQQAAFFRYWTLKESFLKACGKGLSVPLNAFWFSLNAGDAPRIHFSDLLPERAERWQFFLLDRPEHQIAVTVEGGGDTPVECHPPPPELLSPA